MVLRASDLSMRRAMKQTMITIGASHTTTVAEKPVPPSGVPWLPQTIWSLGPWWAKATKNPAIAPKMTKPSNPRTFMIIRTRRIAR